MARAEENTTAVTKKYKNTRGVSRVEYASSSKNEEEGAPKALTITHHRHHKLRTG